jgi:transcriptional regulator with XRE-family HTH domain
MRSAQQTFGQAIRRLRERAGYSQEKFAQMANIDRTYMSEIERGVTNVSLEMVYRLAKALDVTLVELFTEVESGGDAPRRSNKAQRE